MSSVPGERIDVLSPDSDSSLAPELADAQTPVVLSYESKADQPGPTLKQRAIRGSIWTLSAFALGQVIRFVSGPVLARFLVPEHFGVVSLVALFVTAVEALSDMGIEPSVIQNKRGDEPVFLNTAWTVGVVRGVTLWIATCIITWPVYYCYSDKPGADYLLYLLPVAGLGSVLNGLKSTSTFTLSRHLELGKVTLVHLGYQIVNAIVSIILAWQWKSPWAIVFGGLTANVFVVLVTHVLIKGYRNRFCWDKQVRRELMIFGRWIIISTLITYAAGQIDRAILGGMLDLTWVGLYGIALALIGLPREVIGRLAGVTLYPTLARTAESNPQNLGSVLVRARGLILSVTLATMLAVVLGAPLFIMVFYKPEYHPAGFLAQLAAVSAWFMMLTASADRALLAVGSTKPLALSNAVNLVFTVAGSLAGWWVDRWVTGSSQGTSGFILGLSVGKIACHLVIQVELARQKMSIYRQDTVYTLAMIAVAALGIVAPRWFPSYYSGQQVLTMGIVTLTLCGVVGAAAAWKVLRSIR